MQDTAGSGSIEQRADAPKAAAPEIAPAGPWQTMRQRLADLRLPTKLLVITLLFVMLAEVLVFVPSIANFRLNWLENRVASARLASLAAEASKGGKIPAMVRRDLLSTAKVLAVAVKKDDTRRLVLPSDEPLVVDVTFDLRGMTNSGIAGWFGRRLGLIGDALYVFVAPRGRTLAIYGSMVVDTANGKEDFVEVVLPEEPLREAMIRHGLNILMLSIVISIIAAAAVYFTLIKVLVRPMMRITDNMVHFGENPEDPTRIIEPGARVDEIGVAERELASMQTQLNQLLHQRKRLAELGLAVSKINHDLRNMLASAQLFSDRLSELPDPSVQRFAPKLIASLDRAINFCNATLRFGRAEEAAPHREVFALAPLVSEVADGLDLPRGYISWENEIPENLQVDADRDHLYRVLNNLMRNAVQAIEGTGKPGVGGIVVTAAREGRHTIIEVDDDGPGVPEKARESLFKAFAGGARGSGLGLAVAAELVRAHGGEISLLDTKTGATFRIDIPDRQATAQS